MIVPGCIGFLFLLMCMFITDNCYLHFNAFHGYVVLIPWLGHNFIRYFHAFNNSPEDRILMVQVPGVLHNDKELRTGTVRVRAPRHRYGTAYVGLIVKLRRDHITRTTRPILAPVIPARSGIATLDHEARDYPVKQGAVVETGFG